MAHLDKLPTWFVKGDERRAAYYTVNASELRADGWVEEGEKAAPAPVGDPLPEIPVEAGVDAFDIEPEEEGEEEVPSLEELTKAELLEVAAAQNLNLKSTLSKAKIIEAIEASL